MQAVVARELLVAFVLYKHIYLKITSLKSHIFSTLQSRCGTQHPTTIISGHISYFMAKQTQLVFLPCLVVSPVKGKHGEIVIIAVILYVFVHLILISFKVPHICCTFQNPNR